MIRRQGLGAGKGVWRVSMKGGGEGEIGRGNREGEVAMRRGDGKGSTGRGRGDVEGDDGEGHDGQLEMGRGQKGGRGKREGKHIECLGGER